MYIIVMRKKLPDDQKKRKVSFTIDPKIFQLFEKYCKENQIENHSSFIEKIIVQNLEKK
jgi:hypothetical protein